MTRIALLTREYPPDVYGGAGVHVEYLSRELAKLVDVGVYCFGEPRNDPLVAGAYEPWGALGKSGKGAALRAVSVDLRMAENVEAADLVHSHTWYTNFGGFLSQVLYDLPHVMTCHSLEPLRPWKAEQLGPGYRLSSWVERAAIDQADAVIAVSQAMREDVLTVYPAVDPARVKVVYNGIDPEEFFPTPGPMVSSAWGSTLTPPLSCSSGGSRAKKASLTCSTPRRPSSQMHRPFSVPAPPIRPRSS